MNPYKPVFVFSACWRSGSTLVQRYITASGEVLVWGESGGALNDLYSAHLGWKQMLSDEDTFHKDGIGGRGALAYEEFFSKSKDERPHSWIATMNPPLQQIENALRDLLLNIYVDSTREAGYQRFGVKATRGDLPTARFLRTLFPEAKFVFLVRDPLAVLLSIKRHNWMERPASQATLRYFCEHWLTRAAQFRQADFGMAFRYEDFIGDAGLRDRLMDYLEIDSRPAEDFIQSSRVDWMTRDTSRLTAWERGWIRHWLGGEMGHWKYQ
jgi:hypothetical protein